MNTELTESDLWRNLKVDSFHYLCQGVLHPDAMDVASKVYPPQQIIPEYLLCRISDSTKRLGDHLEKEEVHSDWWGQVFHLSGTGSPVGMLVKLNSDKFNRCIYTPDGINLINKDSVYTDNTVVEDNYTFKSFRVFAMNNGDSSDHDLMFTIKNRWFRKRNNPKFLGFSKEKK